MYVHMAEITTCICFVVTPQFQAMATAIYSSRAQDSSPTPLNGNYREPQLTDNRIVLVSFKEGVYGLQNGLLLFLVHESKGHLNCLTAIVTALL